VLRGGVGAGRTGEINRPTDSVGLFPNDGAIVRLAGAIRLEQNDEWAAKGGSMTLESVAPLSDDPIVGLPIMTS
jgi:putative transposase